MGLSRIIPEDNPKALGGDLAEITGIMRGWALGEGCGGGRN